MKKNLQQNPDITITEKTLTRLDAFFDSFPWLLPAAGFIAGWLSFLLVQRGADLARVIAATVLVGWLWLLAQPFILNLLKNRISPQHLTLLSNFVSQSIQQEILFFSLPFLLFSTSLDAPGQIVFTSLVAVLALLSTVDPWYEKYIATDRVLSLSYHAFCSFISALVILPVVAKIPSEKSFMISMSVVVLWLVVAGPLLYRRLTMRNARMLFFLVVVTIPAGLMAFNSQIPPAGISITRSVITDRVTDHQPGKPVLTFRETNLKSGVYAYASIVAPQGLTQDIIFEWSHGNYREEIVSTIIGGRESGYRTYSVKDNFVDNAEGRWAVEIRTPQGQLLRVLKFDVVDG